MKEYIMLTDTHIGYKNSDYWNQVHLKFFEEVCNTAKKKGIKELIHLGDWFDERKSLNVKHAIDFSLNEIVPLLVMSFDKIYIILGNHDTYFKDKIDVNSLSVFKYIDNFIIVKEPMVIDNHMKLFPWGYIPGEDDKNYICRGHWEINGATINASGKVATGFKYNLSDFKGIKQVESGHFHTPGEYGNICYIGAPYHMDHNDRGDRGYYIITEESKEFIPYINGPEFMDLFVSVKEDTIISNITNIKESIYIRKNDGDNKLLSDLNINIEGNYIRLVYINELGSSLTYQVNKYIHSFNPKTVKVKFLFTTEENSETEDVIDISDDEKDLLIKYISIKNPPSHINKNILKGLIQKIIEEGENGEDSNE